MSNKIKVIEHAEISDFEGDLYYEHKGDVVCLHDESRCHETPSRSDEVGWFKVWYDAEMEDREYITINDSILYLDTIDRL